MSKKRIVKRILIVLVSLMFVMSAYTKFTSNKTIVEMLASLNLSNYRTALGIIDIVIGVSLWNKRTRRIGIMIGTAYLGGAIASEFSLGGTGIVPGLCILLLWIIQKIDLWNCSCGKCNACLKKAAATPVSNI